MSNTSAPPAHACNAGQLLARTSAHACPLTGVTQQPHVLVGRNVAGREVAGHVAHSGRHIRQLPACRCAAQAAHGGGEGSVPAGEAAAQAVGQRVAAAQAACLQASAPARNQLEGSLALKPCTKSRAAQARNVDACAVVRLCLMKSPAERGTCTVCTKWCSPLGKQGQRQVPRFCPAAADTPPASWLFHLRRSTLLERYH